jgi:hypothetical protein
MELSETCNYRENGREKSKPLLFVIIAKSSRFLVYVVILNFTIIMYLPVQYCMASDPRYPSGGVPEPSARAI